MLGVVGFRLLRSQSPLDESVEFLRSLRVFENFGEGLEGLQKSPVFRLYHGLPK
jgi:hypothetical protein